MGEQELVFFVNMLGGLSFYYDGKAFSIKCSDTSKVMQLFLMLLKAGEEGISKEELTEALYGRDNTQDTKNAFRILIFRLRKLIGNTILPPDEYIRMKKGIYRFGGHLKILIDAKEFEKNANTAIHLSDEEKKLRELKEVCRSYKGEFLSPLAGEEWTEEERVYYKNIYCECLQECIRLMKERQQYEEMLELCSNACEIYPFDEWQLIQIDCLLAMNHYKEAFGVYERATALFFEKLGMPPSEKMLSRFRIMNTQIHYAMGSLTKIKDELKEKEFDKRAYYCSYPSFIDSYRIITRMIERSGQSAFLMLCTLTDNKGNPLNKEEILTEQSINLGQSIEYSLRRGDLYTRYSPNQFLILLIGINQEDCEIAFGRISSMFRKKCPSQKIRIHYYVSTIAEIRSEGTKRNFRHSGNLWKKKH